MATIYVNNVVKLEDRLKYRRDIVLREIEVFI